MLNSRTGYVFLTECRDLSDAQVVKSYLESKGFHPRIRDEQTRSIASHYSIAMGKLILDIPEIEFMEASLALEAAEKSTPPLSATSPEEDILSLSKKCLWNAILGLILVPILCNLYSMLLGFRVLKAESPLSPTSRRRLLWAIFFNSLSFYVWLTMAPKFLKVFL